MEGGANKNEKKVQFDWTAKKFMMIFLLKTYFCIKSACKKSYVKIRSFLAL